MASDNIDLETPCMFCYGNTPLWFVQCCWCKEIVPYEGFYIAPVTEELEWKQLQELHKKGCKWASTRAFRVDMEGRPTLADYRGEYDF